LNADQVWGKHKYVTVIKKYILKLINVAYYQIDEYKKINSKELKIVNKCTLNEDRKNQLELMVWNSDGYLEFISDTDWIIKGRENYEGSKPLPILDYLEYHVTWNCNLKCKGCAHYCNVLSEPLLGNYDQFYKDIWRLGELFSNIKTFRLLGGEPLLNPEVGRFAKVVRDVFPNANIEVATNGLLIPSLDENILKTLKECEIIFDVSFYPPTKQRINSIISIFQLYGFRYRISPSKSEFYCLKSTKEHKKIRKAFKHCPAKGCHSLYDGKISVCGIPTIWNTMNGYVGFDYLLSDSDFIDIYEVNDGCLINDIFSLSIPFCRYCHTWDVCWFEWEGWSEKVFPEDGNEEELEKWIYYKDSPYKNQ